MVLPWEGSAYSNLLAKEPGRFAAAFSIAGGGNPQTAEKLVDTPLWIFHGSEDAVVPVSYSRNMYNAIRAAGGTKVRYIESFPWQGSNKIAQATPSVGEFMTILASVRA
jgi:predicted peptidase